MDKNKVVLMLDKERHLFYDINALVALEEMGIDLSALGTGVKFKQLRGLIWAGLIHEDSEITLEEVGAMISMENITLCSEAIQKAVSTEGKK